MLNLLTEREAIARAQSTFARTFTSACESKHRVMLGFQGGNVEADVFWHADLRIWGSFNRRPIDTKDDRFWNAFGTADPAANSMLSITCEINPPHEGLNRRVAGGFAVDRSSGKVFVVHRGNIGGGRKGVGQTAFWQGWDEEQAVAVDEGNGRSARVAMIACLNDPALPAQIDHFVKYVAGVKSGKNAAGDVPGTPSSDFTPEFEGGYSYDAAQQVTAAVNHGVVVNALRRLLAASGVVAFRDQARDLFTLTENELGSLFEVKTTVSTTDIYTAVGQLFIHGRLRNEACTLVMVLPSGDAAANWRKRLSPLGIEVLEYELSPKNVTFHSVDRLLSHP